MPNIFFVNLSVVDSVLPIPMQYAVIILLQMTTCCYSLLCLYITIITFGRATYKASTPWGNMLESFLHKTVQEPICVMYPYLLRWISVSLMYRDTVAPPSGKKNHIWKWNRAWLFATHTCSLESGKYTYSSRREDTPWCLKCWRYIRRSWGKSYTVCIWHFLCI